MKQTLEEVAKEAAEDCYEMPYDEKLINMKLIKEAFKYGAGWQKEQAIEILSAVLENWVHGGDADCIIAEFEEKINVQMVTN